MIVYREIISILSRSLNRDFTEEDLTLSPIEDLKMDSIQIIDFVIQIEDTYGISISNFSNLAEHMSTVKEMVLYLVEVLEEKE